LFSTPTEAKVASTLYLIVERREKRRLPDKEKTSKIREFLN
jgi:hypothetical protein